MPAIGGDAKEEASTYSAFCTCSCHFSPHSAPSMRLEASRCRLLVRVPPAASKTLAILTLLHLAVSSLAAEELVSNGGFERGFDGWTRWGQNAKLITLDTASFRSGTNCARIPKGHNALYFTHPLAPGQAYELSFAYRLAGANPSGQVALGFFKQGGGLNSAGSQKFKLLPPVGQDAGQWTEFRQVFLPTAVTSSAQFAFTAGDGSTFWLDDVSLRAVPRPAGLVEPSLPWEGQAGWEATLGQMGRPGPMAGSGWNIAILPPGQPSRRPVLSLSPASSPAGWMAPPIQS